MQLLKLFENLGTEQKATASHDLVRQALVRKTISHAALADDFSNIHKYGKAPVEQVQLDLLMSGFPLTPCDPRHDRADDRC